MINPNEGVTESKDFHSGSSHTAAQTYTLPPELKESICFPASLTTLGIIKLIHLHQSDRKSMMAHCSILYLLHWVGGVLLITLFYTLLLFTPCPFFQRHYSASDSLRRVFYALRKLVLYHAAFTFICLEVSWPVCEELNMSYQNVGREGN